MLIDGSALAKVMSYTSFAMIKHPAQKATYERNRLFWLASPVLRGWEHGSKRPAWQQSQMWAIMEQREQTGSGA